MREDPQLEAMLDGLGVSREDRMIAKDLSRNAAEKALESIRLVAQSVPSVPMQNVIMLSACLMVGNAAEKTIVERIETVKDQMPPEIREVFDEMFKKPEQKRQAVRDFDGNYR